MSWREAVAEAVKDPFWQVFRYGLKGLPTREKLYWLARWIDGEVASPPEDGYTRSVQAANYLGALARGGFVKLHDTPLECVANSLAYGCVEILK